MISLSRIVILACVLHTNFAKDDAEVHSEFETSVSEKCVTELANEDSPSLFISTLDGSFLRVSLQSGKILWQFKDDAVVKVPSITKNSIRPLFLPDPKDGSLYTLSVNSSTDKMNALGKVQFSIPQLVSMSPCRTPDGIFYSGKKTDSWSVINYKTGEREDLLALSEENKVEDKFLMYLGKSQYTLLMHDMSQISRQWNVTFYNYAANSIPADIYRSDFSYFASSSSGKFVVLGSKVDGSVLWEADFSSPVIGVYTHNGVELLSLPFTTIDDESLSLISKPAQPSEFYPTLYIGEHVYGLFAVAAIANIQLQESLIDVFSTSTRFIDNASNPSVKADLPVIVGHYQYPEFFQQDRLQITGRSDAIIESNGTNVSFSRNYLRNSIMTNDLLFASKSDNNMELGTVYRYFADQEHLIMKGLMLFMVASVTAMFFYLRSQLMELKQHSNPSASSTVGKNCSDCVTATLEELPDGSCRVGKIHFRPDQVVGKGCEGTFVFRGKFDDREVAVKRLLPECFSIADREVALLRESDEHPNVIRYFCMEQDKQFRYIALELCAATLQDYTEKGVMNELITPIETAKQALAGLEYLHTLNIVHRDIKPHNVLLSYPKSGAQVRAMISDFGLCKKLQMGRASFSRHSGVTGTDGWIAPEMMYGNKRTTTSVDIFSFGCVLHYVLSKGRHPFGDSIRRQANILNGDAKISDTLEDRCDLWRHLILKMISKDPNERPPAKVVKCHPAFWNSNNLLNFLQDASDRIEKEDTSSAVLVELEKDGYWALGVPDWRNSIEPEIALDLRKYRNYRGDSVRDLLRALRNKKHHYRELSRDVKMILGSIPNGFVTYWTNRFPHLLLHTWLSMQCVKDEAIFEKYYAKFYEYSTEKSGHLPKWLRENECTNSNNSNIKGDNASDTNLRKSSRANNANASSTADNSNTSSRANHLNVGSRANNVNASSRACIKDLICDNSALLLQPNTHSRQNRIKERTEDLDAEMSNIVSESAYELDENISTVKKNDGNDFNKYKMDFDLENVSLISELVNGKINEKLSRDNSQFKNRNIAPLKDDFDFMKLQNTKQIRNIGTRKQMDAVLEIYNGTKNDNVFTNNKKMYNANQNINGEIENFNVVSNFVDATNEDVRASENLYGKYSRNSIQKLKESKFRRQSDLFVDNKNYDCITRRNTNIASPSFLFNQNIANDENDNIADEIDNIANGNSNIARMEDNIADDNADIAYKNVNIANDNANIAYKNVNIANDSANIAYKNVNIANDNANTVYEKDNIAKENCKIGFKNSPFYNQEGKNIVYENENIVIDNPNISLVVNRECSTLGGEKSKKMYRNRPRQRGKKKNSISRSVGELLQNASVISHSN